MYTIVYIIVCVATEGTFGNILTNMPVQRLRDSAVLYSKQVLDCLLRYSLHESLRSTAVIQMAVSLYCLAVISLDAGAVGWAEILADWAVSNL
jgi:hypothetical protein